MIFLFDKMNYEYLELFCLLHIYTNQNYLF